MLRSEDCLLLCSATFLEYPPAVLGVVRGSTPGADAVEALQRALAATAHAGATALMRRADHLTDGEADDAGHRLCEPVGSAASVAVR